MSFTRLRHRVTTVAVAGVLGSALAVGAYSAPALAGNTPTTPTTVPQRANPAPKPAPAWHKVCVKRTKITRKCTKTEWRWY